LYYFSIEKSRTGSVDLDHPQKWYYTLFGFTCYLTVGAFLMQTFKMSDAFHIAEPLLPGTPLTAWVMAPMYAFAYAVILFAFEIVRKRKNIK
jgi:hypothetical protein